MPRISMMDRLNSTSKMSTATEEYKPMVLDYDSLIPSEDNFYPAVEIEELADNILTCGHIEPIIVGRVNGRDRIVSGHRRYFAIGINIQRGHAEFKKVNCMIRVMSEPMYLFTLASANAFTRKLDDTTLIRQAEVLKSAMKELVESGEVEIHGKMRDYLADTLGISSTKMAQVDKISSSLVEEGKRALESGEMNFSKAYETSRLPEEAQRMVIEDDSLLSADVREMVRGMNISYSVSESDTQEQRLPEREEEPLHDHIHLPAVETAADKTMDGDQSFLRESMEELFEPRYSIEEIVDYVKSTGIPREKNMLSHALSSDSIPEVLALRAEATLTGYGMILEKAGEDI